MPDDIITYVIDEDAAACAAAAEYVGRVTHVNAALNRSNAEGAPEGVPEPHQVESRGAAAASWGTAAFRDVTTIKLR